ncbi:8-oxo-dGDP phosphatase NUDT18-like isoform X2 [Periplaneta americana]|uniref:8-oxo-dGDP phosphatase NUDT18-like isoform X2 n=1 Tax=Periplaneta americana TaxID=6978 RepID=UPI0037E7971E
MDRVEENIRRILDGRAVEESQDLCDFTLKDQNEATASPNYRPIVKSTVTYIVVGALVNEDGEILMMQEAKSSCAGKWYLPAGRMEPGEDIMEGVKREVLEETGLEMEPTTLLMVECAFGAWFRFVITGNVTGGVLKTPKDADSESLQAKWIKDLSELNLRADDIHNIIERARSYHARKNEPWHACVLPALYPHKKLLLRVVVCIRKRSNNRVHILLSEKTEVHLPICEINPTRNLHSTLKKFMTEIFGADLPPHKPHGILSIEHNGKPEATNDGLCLTVLVSFRKPLEEVGIIDKYTWLEVSKQLGDELLERLPKNMAVPLHVLR